MVPEGNTSAAGGLRGTTAMKTGDGGPGQSVPQPHTTPETHKAPESNKQPPARKGEAATFTNPEAPNTMVNSLQSASVLDEHRILMGMMAEKIQSAKSGLNEAFSSLLVGFEVRNVIISFFIFYER